MLRKPNKSKYNKSFKLLVKGSIQYKEGKINKLNIGEYGLRSIDYARLTARQLESTRRSIRYHRNRSGVVNICVFPDIPVTNKPNEVRMGKGKGNVMYWSTYVRPGTIRFELYGINKNVAIKALLNSSKKRPIKTNFVFR